MRPYKAVMSPPFDRKSQMWHALVYCDGCWRELHDRDGLIVFSSAKDAIEAAKRNFMGERTMNIKDFDALQPGDTVDNGHGNVGTITAASPSGVHVRWGDGPASPAFHIARMSTVWYSFSIVSKAGGADDNGSAGG